MFQERAHATLRDGNTLSASSDILIDENTEIYIQHYVTDSNVFAFQTDTDMTQEVGSIISVLEPSQSDVTIDTREFITDGQLLLGVLHSNSEFSLFQTNENSVVSFTPSSQQFLRGSTIELGGDVTVNDLLDIHDTAVFEVSEGGVLTMTGSGGPITMQVSNTARIDGQFLAPVAVDFGTGSPDFFVGENGRFEFDDASNFVADRLEVNGIMKCESSLNFDGRSNIKMENLVVNAGGTKIRQRLGMILR